MRRFLTCALLGIVSVFGSTAPVAFADTGFSVVLSSTATVVTSLSSIPITATFSAPPILFDQSMVNTNDTASISDFVAVSDSAYTFNLVPNDKNSDVIVNILAGTVQDANGNPNATANELAFWYETDKPHISLSPNPFPESVTETFSVSVNFTLPVVDFSPNAISLVNATITDFATSSENGKNYTFTVVPTTDGVVSVSVPDNAAHTLAGNEK